MHFAPFFFFFNFGLTRPFRPIRTESARFWPRRRRFQPRRPDSGLATWHDAARTRGLRHPSHVAASRRVGRGCAGLGAASVHPSLQQRGTHKEKLLRLEKLTKIGGNLQRADDHNTEIVSSTKRWRFVMSKRSIQIPKG